MYLFLNKVAVLILLCVAVGCSNQETKTTENKMLDYTALREKVVENVKNKTLKPNDSGVVLLPDDLKSASANHVAYVAEDSASGLMVAFSLMPSGEGKKEYLVNIEKISADGAAPRKIGPLQFSAVQKVDDHWYRATLSR